MVATHKDLSEMKWTYWLWHYFKTISGHFFANYIKTFQRTEVLTVILRCFLYLYLIWIKEIEKIHTLFLLLPSKPGSSVGDLVIH